TFSLLPLYLQNVAGLNATQSGLVLLPGSILMGVLAPVMGRIYDARGPKTLLVPGSIMIAASMFSYSMVGIGTPTWVLVVIQTVMSLGLAASFTPLFSASLGSLERKLYSHGSAALNTMQQVAGAAGTALLISIYSSALHSGEAAGRSVVESGQPGAHSAFLLAAIIALVPVVLSFFIKKPEDQEDAPAEVVDLAPKSPAE
ncbi:MAG: MFS transporter, partial [Brevibacterium sp.]|nr:MFS transporter [Brevibacterium sp.]